MTTPEPLPLLDSTRNNEHGLLVNLLALEECNIRSQKINPQRFLQSLQPHPFYGAH